MSTAEPHDTSMLEVLRCKETCNFLRVLEAFSHNMENVMTDQSIQLPDTATFSIAEGASFVHCALMKREHARTAVRGESALSLASMSTAQVPHCPTPPQLVILPMSE
eukprot:6186211-Pleurochrysis_carterae.AAC.1